MKSLYLLFSLVLLSQSVFSQHSSRAYLTLADSLFEHHNYQDAATYYQRAIKENPQLVDMMLQVARCYNKINMIQEAEAWFTKAKNQQVPFSEADVYQYVRVLMRLQKHKEGEAILIEHLKQDPEDGVAARLLDDIQNFPKYLKDSAAFIVKSLPINTPVSEFAPVFYKDGIVFSAAQSNQILKKKYHWDNSHFLNLFYSGKTGEQGFKKPVAFERHLNTRYHDGPASFYAGYQKMIVNRNQLVKTPGRHGIKLSYLALYDAEYLKEKDNWEVKILPFEEPPYSFAHPSISEDGNVLFFVSDKPGGYGGTDIYRVTRKNGIWGEPFNLGPSVNTSSNEAFPFFVNGILYFASQGHGGLGGLDIFKSIQNVNGFSPPVNLGYPINSYADDFSIVTTDDQLSGYFASSRNGNDDLFSFDRASRKVRLLANIFDDQTKNPLTKAEIQLVTSAGEEVVLVSDSVGNVSFELPVEAVYLIVVNKNGKLGMLSGAAVRKEDADHMVHQVPVYNDTTRIACIGTVKDESGVARKASDVAVFDETTGKIVDHDLKNSLINFLGEKGHAYRVEVKNTKGDTAVHRLQVNPEETIAKKWSMILKDSPALNNVAARVFRPDDNQPLSGARVKVITFSEPDKDLIADEDGIVEFSLKEGTAYMVVGEKDSLTGMYSGIVEPDSDKKTTIHPVPAYGEPPKPVIIVSLVRNSSGEILNDASAVLTDKATGQRTAVDIKDGVLNFFGERGKEYAVHVEHPDHKPTTEHIIIPTEADPIEKISISLERNKKQIAITGQIVDKAGNMLSEAAITVTDDVTGVQIPAQNNKGVLNFTGEQGRSYAITVEHPGHKPAVDQVVIPVSAAKTDELSIVLEEEKSPVMVAGLITDNNGHVLPEAHVTVTDHTTGKVIPVSNTEGNLSFTAESGKQYTINTVYEGYKPSISMVTIPKDAGGMEKLSITLQAEGPLTQTMAVRVFKASDQKALEGAKVEVITFTEPDQELVTNADGIADFTLPDGLAYMVIGSKDGYVGMNSGMAEKGMDKASIIHPVSASKDRDDQLPIVGRVTDKEGNVLKDANVSVIENTARDTVQVQQHEGLLSFFGEKGKTYTITTDYKGYETATDQFTIPKDASSSEKISITLKDEVPVTALKDEAPLTRSMAVRVFKTSDQKPLSGAKVQVINFIEPDQELVANAQGIADFTLPDGLAYIVIGSKKGYAGSISGLAEKGTEKASVIHPIAVSKVNDDYLPVVGRIIDKEGNMLTEASVTVTEKIAKDVIQVQQNEGILNFWGEKGKTYSITIQHEDYRSEVKEISIPLKGSNHEKITVVLEDRGAGSTDKHQMAARIFKATDQEPLAGAEVKILLFTEADMEIVADHAGLVDFALPDGATYMIVASKDGFSGMLAGIAEKAADKSSIIHSVPVYSDPNQLPVVGLIADENGLPVTHAEITIKDKVTNEAVPVNLQQGVLSFFGKKKNTYTVNVKAEGFESLQKQIVTGAGNNELLRVDLSLKRKVVLGSSNLVILNAHEKTAKYYIGAGDSLREITEKNGKLYVQGSNQSKILGEGSLKALRHTSDSVLHSLGLSAEVTIAVGNIYFDFNKTLLDQEDRSELDKVKLIIERYSSVRLVIGTHADDRGSNTYNLGLSRRRAKAIGAYLGRQGISSNRVVISAYGETLPAIPCAAAKCTEEEHKQNRRAEFALTSKRSSKTLPGAAKTANRNAQRRYEEVLKEFGNRQKDSVVFKVNVGAYRYNSTLTFPELQDLGSVESRFVNGITYYYVGDFNSLNAAESVRQQIIKRSVKDAIIAIFYKGERISFSTFISMFE